MIPELYDKTISARRVLMTGCSGAGKSSLIGELAKRGVTVAREPGVRVIRLEARTGGSGVPWDDALRFAKLCLKMATADWEAARAGLTLFDRGVFDAALHLESLGQADAARDYLTRFPYDTEVFVAAPWQALFNNDTERRHSFEAAVAEYDSIRAGLTRLGYKAVEVPQVPLAERANWLEDRLIKS